MTDEENAAMESFRSDFRELLKLHSVTVDTDDAVALGDVLFRGSGWFISILEEANYLRLKPLNYRSRKTNG